MTCAPVQPDLPAFTAMAAALGPREAGVWSLRATAGHEDVRRWRMLLTPAELERYSRMRAGQGQDEFLAGRATLRLLLGAALGLAPLAVDLRTGIHGKPWTQGIEFNVAHSRGQVLIALCRSAAVGVDLEWVNPAIEAVDIARGSFTPAEAEAIERAGSRDAQIELFFRCWTRKEAVVKAHGQGLTLPLDQFTVPTVADDALGEHGAEVLSPRWAEPLSPRWEESDRVWVHALPTPRGFRSSLAIKSVNVSVSTKVLNS